MKFRKRQLILASLVVALGAAVYLNWQFSDGKGLEVTNILHSTDELGEARYVNNSHFSDKSSEENLSTSLSDSAKIKKYFTEAQIERQKSHDETQEKLKSLLATPNLNSDIKDKIMNDIDNFSKIIKQESNIEHIIKSKGFSDCLAFIQDDECNIIVNPGSLNENSVVIIRDVVASQSGISSNKIKIIEAK